MKITEKGYVPFGKYKTYYEIYGQPSSKTPLLMLHGGPGGAHNYLIGLTELAEDRQVIFYDQLGCGLSDLPDDESLWTTQTFLDEIKAVREHLKLDEIHLYGHSWGGMLAIDYLLTQPKGIKSAILASAMISMPLYQEEVEKLKKALPGDTYKIMTKHEQAGTTDSNEYAAAYLEYRKRHLYRYGGMLPPELVSPNKSAGKASYVKMWGVSEAYADGDMKNWDRVKQLHEINVPTLIISGEYDELTPHQAEITHKEIAGSELCIIKDGSHLAHVEKPKEYITALKKFLNDVEQS